MADASNETSQLLQARVNADIMARFTRQRERWGMTNQTLLEKILEQALPEWEKAEGPPVSATR